MSPAAQVICVTPARNEAWILEAFLSAASVWADRIIVADQGSTDGSREIAARFPKVTLLDNASTDYDELARQRLLIEEARSTPGKRLIVALDADEGLGWQSWETPEWQALRRAPEGTVAQFDWVNLLPGLDECWIPPTPVPFAFVDDGSAHHGDAIHSHRVPSPPDASIVSLNDVKVLHFQYLQWARMKSKQRWYQCWEAIHLPGKRPVHLYRQYHRMDAPPQSELHSVNPDWVSGYVDHPAFAGGEATRGVFYWDREVLEWLVDLGPARFRRIDIWDADWADVARRTGRCVPAGLVVDPRSRLDRAVHAWLRRSQGRSNTLGVRVAQRALAPLGW